MNKRKLFLVCIFFFAAAFLLKQHNQKIADFEEKAATESVQTVDSEESDVSNSESASGLKTETDSLQSSREPFWENGYYYSQLSDEEKKIYEEIYRAIVNRKEVEVSTMSVDQIDKVNLCVTNDHPEIFNVYGYTYTTHTRDDVLVSILFRAKYIYDEAEEARIKSSIEAEVARILNSAPLGGTDFEKIKYVYDVLVNNTAYREDAKDNQNIASVFLYHESVCQGYAKATQYLLNRMGVEATLVLGKTESGAHSWNLVKADGEWYYLDTTWGDADFQNENAESVAQGSRPISYDYFLVDSRTLTATHLPTRTVSLPECTAKEDNYFVHENLYLTGLDKKAIGDIFKNGYESGEDAVQFKCSDKAVFRQIEQYLIDDQHVFDYVKTSGSVSYTIFEDTNTFCFFLFNS